MQHDEFITVKVDHVAQELGHVRRSWRSGRFFGVVHVRGLTGTFAKVESGFWSEFIELAPVETLAAAERAVRATALELLAGCSAIELAKDGDTRNRARVLGRRE